MKNKTDTLTVKHDENLKKLESHSNQIKENEITINSLIKELDSSKSQHLDYEKKVTDSESSLKQKDNQVAQLNQDLADLNRKLTEANKQIEILKAELDGANSELEKSKSDGDLAIHYKNELDTMKSEYTSFKDRNENDLSNLKTQLDQKMKGSEQVEKQLLDQIEAK